MMPVSSTISISPGNGNAVANLNHQVFDFGINIIGAEVLVTHLERFLDPPAAITSEIPSTQIRGTE